MINNQNCFAINFGYNGEIPFLTFTMTDDNEKNLEKYEFERYCKCFYVFVGGKYVQDLRHIMVQVEGVSRIFHGTKPVAMFLMGKYSTYEVNQVSTHNNDLPMVHKLTKYITI